MILLDEFETRLRAALSEQSQRLHVDQERLDPGTLPGLVVRPDGRSFSHPGRTRIRRLRQFARVSAGPIAVAVSVAIALLVGGAVLLLGNTSPPFSATRLPTGARGLVSRLAVLRRAQTPADRSLDATTLADRNAFRALVPGLTRLARVLPDGTRIFLVVLNPTREFGPSSDSLAVATITPSSQNAYLVGSATRRPPIPRSYTPPIALQPHTPGPYGAALMFGGSTRPARHLDETLYFEVVPDGVTRVRWVFPRQVIGNFEPAATPAVYARPLIVNVPVHNNVAAIQIPTRGPASIDTWYGNDGHVIASHGTGKNLNRIIPSLAPHPATALSRRAARDPATPNPVHITPAVGTQRTTFTVSFTVLIPKASYSFAVTGGSRPGCAPNYGADRFSGPYARGETFTFKIPARGRGWCPGSYRVTVAANRQRRTYRPFGAATFVVR